MEQTLHITGGDIAGGSLMKSDVSGDVFVWHDILFDGPRKPGWPDEEILVARALFLEDAIAGGLDRTSILTTLRTQYHKLADAGAYEHIVLWFDACLFDQSMLARVLTCLDYQSIREVDLLCVDALPDINPFHGLGQLQPHQLASLCDNRRPVTDSQFRFAILVDKAFATQDIDLLTELSRTIAVPLPWIPAAVTRWLQEQPDPATGLGRLENLARNAIKPGRERYAGKTTF